MFFRHPFKHIALAGLGQFSRMFCCNKKSEISRQYRKMRKAFKGRLGNKTYQLPLPDGGSQLEAPEAPAALAPSPSAAARRHAAQNKRETVEISRLYRKVRLDLFQRSTSTLGD